jgi:hypothetical protein
MFFLRGKPASEKIPVYSAGLAVNIRSEKNGCMYLTQISSFVRGLPSKKSAGFFSFGANLR